MSSDNRQLAEKFAPILQMHAGNPLKPMPVECMLDYATIYYHVPTHDPNNQYKEIKFEREVDENWDDYSRRAKAEVTQNPERWLNKHLVNPRWKLTFDLGKNPQKWEDFFKDKITNYKATVYYQVYKDRREPLIRRKPVIQYWFFYPYDWWANNHECDWERIQVKVSSDNPQKADLLGLVYHYHNDHITLAHDDPSPYNEQWHVYRRRHPLVWVGGVDSTGKNIEHIKKKLTQAGGPHCSGASYPWNYHWKYINGKWFKKEGWPFWIWHDLIIEPFRLLLYPNIANMSFESQKVSGGPKTHYQVRFVDQVGDPIKVINEPEAYELVELKIGKKDRHNTDEFLNCTPDWLEFPGTWGKYSDIGSPPKGPSYHDEDNPWPNNAYPNKPKEVLELERITG